MEKFPEFEKVWERVFGQVTRAYDVFGYEIDKASYGDRTSEYGWCIDHVWPKSKNGSSNIMNLLPMHFYANIEKGEDVNGTIEGVNFQCKHRSLDKEAKVIGMIKTDDSKGQYNK